MMIPKAAQQAKGRSPQVCIKDTAGPAVRSVTATLSRAHVNELAELLHYLTARRRVAKYFQLVCINKFVDRVKDKLGISEDAAKNIVSREIELRLSRNTQSRETFLRRKREAAALSSLKSHPAPMPVYPSVTEEQQGEIETFAVSIFKKQFPRGDRKEHISPGRVCSLSYIGIRRLANKLHLNRNLVSSLIYAIIQRKMIAEGYMEEPVVVR